MAIVTIRSAYGKVGQTYYMMPAVDPSTRRFPDVVKKVNSQGDMILTQDEINSKEYFVPEDRTFVIVDGTTFDLNDPIESRNWEAIKHHPWIAESRFQKDDQGNYKIDGAVGGRGARYGSAELYIDIEGQEAAVSNTKVRQRVKAQGYILEDSDDKLRTKAKVLGRPMLHAHIEDVRDYLLKESEKNPHIIIDLYEGEDMKHRLLLCDARDKNIIIIKNKLYLYGDVNLGASDTMVISFFKHPTNSRIVEMIKKDTYPDLFPSENITKGTKSVKQPETKE